MKKTIIAVAQIGCGYWGPNLLRNFTSNSNCWVKYVAEASQERRSYVEHNFPRSTVLVDIETVLADEEVKAVVVATPAATHYEITKRALKKGKHVLVEKPLAMSVKEAEELNELSKKAGLVLMVGHTFLYNPAVDYLKNLINRDGLGKIYYLYAQRLNLGVIRSDVNAMWNLAPHDISIICHILGKQPISVSVVGVDYIQRGIEDIIFMNLIFSDKTIAHIHVSWLDPNKIRKITIVGGNKMVVYNDVSDDKITIYDKGIDQIGVKREMAFDTVVPFKYVHRSGDIHIPKIEQREPLKIETAHFLDCIENGKQPLSDGENGRDVVAILEAAQKSLNNNGKFIPIIG